MYLHDVEKLEWMIRPYPMTCMACHIREGEHTAKVTNDDITINLVICNNCKNLGESNSDELWTLLTNKQGIARKDGE